eukprot:jgi/Botrbrau1/9819/Bobra.0322s0023.1
MLGVDPNIACLLLLLSPAGSASSPQVSLPPWLAIHASNPGRPRPDSALSFCRTAPDLSGFGPFILEIQCFRVFPRPTPCRAVIFAIIGIPPSPQACRQSVRTVGHRQANARHPQRQCRKYCKFTRISWLHDRLLYNSPHSGYPQNVCFGIFLVISLSTALRKPTIFH